MRGTENLQSYVSTSQLPALKIGPSAPAPPPIGHKSHFNHLRIAADRPRRLEEVINSFGGMDFVRGWTTKAFPTAAINANDEDEELGENLTLPSCSRSFDMKRTWHKPAEDLYKIGDWLEDLPLITVQRLLHLVEASTLRWRFKRVHDKDLDREIFQYFYWSYAQDGSTTPIGQEMKEQIAAKSVVVAFQPPWVLSRADMKQMTTTEYPHSVLVMEKMTSKERLWGKIWDVCVQKDAHYFVLTSYEQWIFGAFSRHWTTVCISDILEYNAHGPSVTEALTYWIASAMRFDTGLVLPKGRSSLLPPLVKPPVIANDAVVLPDASESNWTGKSDDVASSVGYHTASVSSKVSDSGVYPTSAPIHRQSTDTAAIRRWMADV